MNHICQLHCHSSLSFKDGLASEKALVERAAELEMPGLGLTNHGHLFAAHRFASACAEHGIKPILGMEAYEAVSHTFDTDLAGPDHQLFKAKYDPNVPRYFHLTIWVINQKGWENLCALHTLSYTRAYKPKNQPLIDRATLEQHSEGLIIGLGCPASRTNQALEHGYNSAVDAAKWYFEVFGKDRVCVEVMTALPEQVAHIADQRKLARYFGAQTVGTNDVHYLRQKDGVPNGPHHILVQARKYRSAEVATDVSGDKSDDAFGSYYGSDQFYLKTREEMLESGLFVAEVDATMAIMERVEFDFNAMPEPEPPKAAVPEPGEDLAFDSWLSGQ
jgi:DNA polymerase-3 subunit alpha